MKLFLSAIISMLLFGACSSNTSQVNSGTKVDSISESSTLVVPDSFVTGSVISNIACRKDATQSYALYIPKSISNKSNPRVIYFFDSHGDGTFPLLKYKEIAEELGVILVGSNNSKNGNDWTTTAQIWNALITDTKSRLKFDEKKIYTCGFSGGAKVAGYIAINNPIIKGVILNSAAFNEPPPAMGYSFDFIGLAGEGDMNMTDLVSLESQLASTKMRSQLLLFDGKHEWAPTSTMRDAFLWTIFNEIKDKSTPVDEKLIANFLADKKKMCDQFNQKKQFLKLENTTAQVLNFMSGLNTDLTYFKSLHQKTVDDKSYKQLLIAQQNLLTTEQNIKQSYAPLLQNMDLKAWTEIIKDLNKKANSTSAEAPMYQRLLAYLSLASYSISNRCLNQNQNEQASNYVELYKMVDPENSEAWYFSALLNARNNNSTGVEDDLKMAIKTGFKDSNRMHLQNEFQILNPQINFQMLDELMKSK